MSEPIESNEPFDRSDPFVQSIMWAISRNSQNGGVANEDDRLLNGVSIGKLERSVKQLDTVHQIGIFCLGFILGLFVSRVAFYKTPGNQDGNRGSI